jgi:hypothetical protein
MNESRKGILSSILLERANIIEIFVTAIIVALGVNLVANSLSSFSGFTPISTFIVGTALCSIPVVYLVFRVSSSRTKSRIYKGFFVYDEKNNKTIDVPRYNFSEYLNDYLGSAFYENKALKSLWDKEPLKNINYFDANTKKFTRRTTHSSQLICEATEYYVLSLLSTHLTDYFNDDKFKKENLKNFGRGDVPDVLLENRFMELFSRPMENRPLFVEDTVKERYDERTVAVYKGGARYERFDLVLPKQSITRRLSKDEIQIETDRFVITAKILFEGSSTVTPRYFEKYYLSLEKFPEKITEYEVRVCMKVRFKFGKLLSRKGWEYYRWIDSFLDTFDRRFSKDTFVESIGWDTAATIMEYLDTRLSREQARSKTRRQNGL